MSLPEKVEEVKQVFKELDEQIEKFQTATGLHCKFGCGKCCFKSDIEATVLEFIPFAFHLYHTEQAEEWFNKLNQQESSICAILNPTQPGAGLCSEYPYRGLICRLFGFSARTNKYGKKELVTCQIIKEEQKENFDKATIKIENGLDIPVMNQFYMRLHSIDFELTSVFYPINEAIERAIEVVLQYYAYR
jgi:Fe-S-cluster containining protein